MDLLIMLLQKLVLGLSVIVLAISGFFNGRTAAPAPLPAPVLLQPATSSPAASSELAASSTPAQAEPEVPQKQRESAPAPKPAAPVVSAPLLPSVPAKAPEAVNAETRASLVNILCVSPAGGSFSPISGSGIIVDTRGIILTNAHVAQYFLLDDYGVQCVIRTGSPARTQYFAELLYLSPRWIAENAGQLVEPTPTGTGENDFAFLRITGTTDLNGSLPASFPAIPMDAAEPQTGESVLLAAYPAGFLGGTNIALNLYISSAFATVGRVFAFTDSGGIDLFSAGGTVVSQSGSSGGAAVRAGSGKLIGIITTDTNAATTAERDLRAITVAHINRSLAQEGEGGVAELVLQDAARAASTFKKNIIPQEKAALKKILER